MSPSSSKFIETKSFLFISLITKFYSFFSQWNSKWKELNFPPQFCGEFTLSVAQEHIKYFMAILLQSKPSVRALPAFAGLFLRKYKQRNKKLYPSSSGNQTQ